MIKRRKTRQIKVGNVKIGGDVPISIQSMANTETADIENTILQIKTLEKSGCEIIRVAVKSFDDADAIKVIKERIKIPLVADIHFNYRLALRAIESGADKIRLNPGNIRQKDEIEQVVKAAKRAHIPIRIGVNSGSVTARNKSIVAQEHKSDLAGQLVNSALGYIKLFEAENFRDIIISLKGSDVVSTIDAYRKIADLCNYPLHLGITASGPYDSAIVKSSIGIGALLLDGIGDTIRVSLTADPVEEIGVARKILSSLGIRKFGPEIISCPTCGRCQVDLIGIVKELEDRLSMVQAPKYAGMKIAVMGCEVNGPGEAAVADIGIAFGKNSGVLFKNGRIVKKVSVKNAVKELMKYF